LLRVLETGEFIKVGSSKVQKTNVRVVRGQTLIVKAIATEIPRGFVLPAEHSPIRVHRARQERRCVPVVQKIRFGFFRALSHAGINIYNRKRKNY